MDVTISLSEEARTLYDQNVRGYGMGYASSRFLADAFVKNEHNLKVVHPNDLFRKSEKIFARKTFKFNEWVFSLEKENSELFGDVFFVYSLDEERGYNTSKRFIDSLYDLENQFNCVFNSAECTSYEYKPKQKTLENLPWIPGFDIKTTQDLSSLIASGERIIAKPKIGACGQGVVFLEKEEDVKKIQDITEFLFEKYIYADEERRYIFLDNQCVIRRRIKKVGFPGKEKCINVDLMEGNEKELNIARYIVSSLKMFYGAVDFRGDYLLEINGSGTGVAPPTVANKVDLYNLSDSIVQAVERRLRKK